MATRILDVGSDPAALDLVVARLQASQPVAIPTETVYGLAANALDPLACSRIFQAKDRPTDNPLICHIASLDMLPVLAAAVPDCVRPVLDRFWPGPLTVLLPKTERVPDIVSAGLPTVGVRLPQHPVALDIIRACGFPLAAPSANRSGRPSPTTAQHVLADLAGRIECIVDGGPAAVGLESTVLDVTRSPPTILRPGAITEAMLRPFLPDVQTYGQHVRDAALEARPPTPGMKYKHYAPTAPVVLVRPGPDLEARVQRFLAAAPVPASVVRLCTRDRPAYPAVTNMCLSRRDSLPEIARNLFAGLRDADLLAPAAILAEAVDDTDDARAIMNRLGKAASSTI
jgi:L-threonylcarbamoyladenylate synthase